MKKGLKYRESQIYKSNHREMNRRRRLSGEENEEASVDENVVESQSDSGELRDESEGEDLHGDNMMDDYRSIPELDQYDQQDMDEEEYSQMGIEDQRRAEQELDQRDQHLMRHRDRRIPMAI